MVLTFRTFVLIEVITCLHLLSITTVVHQALFGIGAIDYRLARLPAMVEAQILATDVRGDVGDYVIFVRIQVVAAISERVPDAVGLCPVGANVWIWKPGGGTFVNALSQSTLGHTSTLARGRTHTHTHTNTDKR